MSEQRVLPADIYDTLELSALAYGGIGQPSVQEYQNGVAIAPCCIHGHANWSTSYGFVFDDEISRVLVRVGVDGRDSDEAVRRINHRKRREPDARVSWPEYTRELNIVRGAA